ncbi:SDR family NAD(P)-dependent oxidoreductase [Acidipila sp. EB88]|uniref:SDR family NAD(P)-dependent oxidoreductase n=1 Tax=Acidipila sp. EB88 TaxID=2305226 RepID=UPI000F5D7B6C|nr:SDR family oxidoreductase [Acidipila sp. EB88]RRA49998.1 SDR family oxidoreductase [Acidipila sp. EB88]
MSVELRFDGKVALVTGGSRGIGAETVRLFVQAGARVVFNYRAANDAAEALVAECGGTDRCRAIRQELGAAEEGRALVETATAAWGRLDALVVNHGVWPSHDAPIETMADAQWRSTMGINLDSVFGLLQAAVARFKQQDADADGRRGHVVLVASTAAQRGEAFHADYAASKGALISLTKSLSSELAGSGISANCVAPGWVATDMSAPALASEAGRAKIFGTIPMGRVGTPAEIAGPILFLCTPWAGFISGEILNVNGGAVLVG